MANDMDRREFLRRTSMAGALAATGAPDLGAPGGSAHTAMTSAEPAVAANRQLDSQEFCLSEYDAMTPALRFTAKDATAARAWKTTARQRLVERLGGFPATRVALRPEILETKDFGTYIREKLVIQTRENLSAIAYFLLPAKRNGPVPAVVCYPGHGRGVIDIVGIAPDGTQRPPVAAQYAVGCVERGFAALAIEPLGFGERRDAAARKAGPEKYSCQPAATAALLLGHTMIGVRVWDSMRAIDYLATRPEIDMARIAALGMSGGGTMSLFAAALDERVKVGVVSAYFNTWRDSIISISHCPDNYVPGLARDMEMADIAGILAPRYLFVESGRNDPIFPIAGSQRAAEHAKQIYRAHGVPERFGYTIHDGAHSFDGVEAFAFLARTL